MSYAVCISHEAEEDLRGIYAYITLNLLSPKNARGQIDRIEKAIQSLDHFPMRYQLIDLEPWESRGLRFMACDSFLILFAKKSMKLWFLVFFMGNGILKNL